MGMVMVPMQMPMEQCMLPNGCMTPGPCSQGGGPGSPMSAMDRYTQDILNADGECFDLGYSLCGDKMSPFAGTRSGFSDASTDTPHANDTTHSRVHSLSSQSGVMSD